MTASPRWRKSQYSAVETNCVELAHTLDTLRDSKNPAGPTLRGNIPALLDALKTSTIKH